MADCSTIDELNDNVIIKVLFYEFKTYFINVTKKKVNRNTNAITLIDRSNDVGTEREYNPKKIVTGKQYFNYYIIV